jgi:diguanylate cyclase
MDYQQSREQSAELLRIVVGLMGKQEAGFHPASYALWYEHAAGVNPSLSRALEQRISSTEPLTDSDVRNLYSRHIVSRDRETIERVEQRLAELLQETSDVVSSGGVQFMQFGASLEGHATQLQRPNALDTLQHIVEELLAETQRMRVTNLTLTRQLDTSAREVTTLTQRLERAQVEALNDPLTRLLNRRGFEEVVAKLYDGSAPLAGASLLMVDIDEFKSINDTYGHLVGDQVLRAVAQILRARIKGADIASRLGGDEFAILLPDTNLTGAAALAEQIRTTLLQRRLRLVDRNQYVENLTLSIGVASAGKEASLEWLLQRADAALYAAKRSGRNRVSTGDPTS